MTETYFKTGIKELDKMLGTEGIPSKNIILIKGGPGSGKTTLGLQIINNHLEGEMHNAGLISLEVDDKRIVEYTKQHFNFSNLDDEKTFITASSIDFKKTIKDYFKPNMGHNELPKAIIKCLDKSVDSKFRNKNYKSILFFDSLNILIDIIQASTDNKMSKREIIKSICMIKNTQDNLFNNTIFIFSVEYHPSLNELNSLVSESFLCDTEILLNIEPVLGISEKSIADISSVGYKIEADKNGKKANEFRSFCRVLKTRFGKHESRRCSYDIVEEEGIKFYETYPGDGQVNLFFENEKQKEAWNIFFTDDIPHQFPSLRYEAFDRLNLQQNFSTKRRYRYVPEKTDLYLGSFDNYWIHWYTDIYRKWTIQEIVEKKSIIFSKYFQENENGYANKLLEDKHVLINDLHAILMKRMVDPKELTERISAKLVIGEKSNRILFLDENNNDKCMLAYEKKSNNTILLKLNNLSKEESYIIRTKVTHLQNIKSFIYVTKENEKNKIYFNNKCDLDIISNNDGIIILIRNNKKTDVLFIYDLYPRIEFEIVNDEENEKLYLVYDYIYNKVFKSDIEDVYDRKILVDKTKGDIVDDNSESIIKDKNADGKIFIEKDEYSSVHLNFPKFINNFLEDDLKYLSNQIINLFSSKIGKNCFECNNIRKLLQEIKYDNSFQRVEKLLFSLNSNGNISGRNFDNAFDWCISFIQENKKSCFRENLQTSNIKRNDTDCLAPLKEKLKQANSNPKRTPKDSFSNLYDEALYSLFFELINKKYLQHYQCELFKSSSLEEFRKIEKTPCEWEANLDQLIESFCITHNIKDAENSKDIKNEIKCYVENKLLNSLDIYYILFEFAKKISYRNKNLDKAGYINELLPSELTHSEKYPTIRESIKENDFDKFKELFSGIIANDSSLLEKYKEIVIDISNIYTSLLRYSESKSFFIPINKEEIRLFGEKKSNIIPELSQYCFEDNRPIHHENFLFSMHNYDKYLSIPYDANIGIFVYNKTKLVKFYKELEEDKNRKEEYCKTITKIFLDEMMVYKYANNSGYTKTVNMNCEKLNDKIMSLINRSINDAYPKTWEEIISIYLMQKEKNCEFVIDAQTYDTYLCTFLEILWNCGGDLCITPDYIIMDKEEKKQYLYQAFYLIAYMYYIGLIPKNSTLEPKQFSKKYNSSDKDIPNSSENWLFMRHWYSTLIELITARRSNYKGIEKKFIWKFCEGNEIALMPMPVSLSKYLEEKNPNRVTHCSCWGDWHLGVLKGSENVTLGIELINNLMSSQKIVERAFNNAALPTTESFYTLYKDTNCFNIPNRSEINIQNITYQELRDMYFKNARSRTQIFDYRHCMREIHSVLKYAEQFAGKKKKNIRFEKFPEYLFGDLVQQIENATNAIGKFQEKDLLRH